MKKETIKIVIIGDVDHGKSTLIGRLLLETKSLSTERLRELKSISGSLDKELELAFLVDQLKEEREEERTIDTTQIFFKTKTRRFCLIDTPGHLEFIKNMMTGATQAEAAILIIDVQMGLGEQTKRYAHILGFLGVRRMIVLINKMDLIGYERERFEKVKKDILSFLKQVGLLAQGVIPISAKKGDNIATRSRYLCWYKDTPLLKALDAMRIETRIMGRPLRFPVQDAYDIKGERIVVGRIESGCMKVGQEILLFPSGVKTKIISIRFFGKKKTEACEGENIGLLLKDASRIKRGDVVCQKDESPRPTTSVAGDLLWLADWSLEINKTFTFRCATQEVGCRVVRIKDRMNSSTLEILERDAFVLKQNEVGQVVFETDEPVVVEHANVIKELGRFVVESEEKVCGVGLISGVS